jgi:hypothetical protein
MLSSSELEESRYKTTARIMHGTREMNRNQAANRRARLS